MVIWVAWVIATLYVTNKGGQLHTVHAVLVQIHKLLEEVKADD